jgi:hypothetical protein
LPEQSIAIFIGIPSFIGSKQRINKRSHGAPFGKYYEKPEQKQNNDDWEKPPPFAANYKTP